MLGVVLSSLCTLAFATGTLVLLKHSVDDLQLHNYEYAPHSALPSQQAQLRRGISGYVAMRHHDGVFLTLSVSPLVRGSCVVITSCRLSRVVIMVAHFVAQKNPGQSDSMTYFQSAREGRKYFIVSSFLIHMEVDKRSTQCTNAAKHLSVRFRVSKAHVAVLSEDGRQEAWSVCLTWHCQIFFQSHTEQKTEFYHHLRPRSPSLVFGIVFLDFGDELYFGKVVHCLCAHFNIMPFFKELSVRCRRVRESLV